MIDVVRIGELELHPLALRDACPCPECRHPVSGQRLFESIDVLPGARAVSASVVDGGLEVVWEDGHRSTFPPDWFRAPEPRRQRRWDASLPLPEHRWGGDVRSLLRDVAELGFAVVHDVPSVEQLVGLFGAVHETNYGRVFDVSVSVDATNLADTARALSVHTDNPYRRPAPTLQVLHCLETAVAGGDSILVDGFAAVARLDPEHVDVLARTPIRFAYRDATSELVNEIPVVSLGPRGEPTALHLNNRSKGVPLGSPEEVAMWYRAYLALLEQLRSPDLELVFRLEAGDAIVFDNERLLHGRTGFEGEGARRLQGCYADRDALESTLAVLERDA